MSFERELNKENINNTISTYLEKLDEIPLKIESDSILGFMREIKRKKVSYGFYKKLTVFESANRIMTDLTPMSHIYSMSKI